MRRWVGTILATVLVGGCATLAGLDDDYQVGGTAASSGVTPTAATTTSSTGAGMGGSTGTGSAEGGTGGSGTASPTGTGGTGGATGSGGAGGGVVQCSGTHTYDAQIADCINLNSPDPDACTTYVTAGIMVISTAEYYSGEPYHAFLRFDLDADVAQSTLASVELQVTVAGVSHAGSTNSGDIWRVVPFVRNDLFSGAPARVGSNAISASQGGVALNETVTWPLPTNIVDGNSVYLEMNPIVTDNTYYLNNTTTPEPQLIVTCQ